MIEQREHLSRCEFEELLDTAVLNSGLFVDGRSLGWYLCGGDSPSQIEVSVALIQRPLFNTALDTSLFVQCECS